MCALLFLLHAADARDAIVSMFWRLNIYGAIMASLFFDARSRKFLVFNHARFPEM